MQTDAHFTLIVNDMPYIVLQAQWTNLKIVHDILLIGVLQGDRPAHRYIHRNTRNECIHRFNDWRRDMSNGSIVSTMFHSRRLDPTCFCKSIVDK